jgi:hypothetical protein
MEGISVDNLTAYNLAADNLAADNVAVDNVAVDNVAADNVAADNVTQGRPRRAASVRAMGLIKSVLQWEQCSTQSSLFKGVERNMNNEFEEINRKRYFKDISVTDTVYDSTADANDSDDEHFIENSTDTDGDHSDSMESFVVSDSVPIEYDGTERSDDSEQDSESDESDLSLDDTDETEDDDGEHEADDGEDEADDKEPSSDA